MQWAQMGTSPNRRCEIVASIKILIAALLALMVLSPSSPQNMHCLVPVIEKYTLYCTTHELLAEGEIAHFSFPIAQLTA